MFHFFSLENLDDTIGESWEISVIKGFESIVIGGDFKNQKLNRLIKKHPFKKGETLLIPDVLTFIELRGYGEVNGITI
jgi:mannose-6-phosphate isomerase class I